MQINPIAEHCALGICIFNNHYAYANLKQSDIFQSSVKDIIKSNITCNIML